MKKSVVWKHINLTIYMVNSYVYGTYINHIETISILRLKKYAIGRERDLKISKIKKIVFTSELQGVLKLK